MHDVFLTGVGFFCRADVLFVRDACTVKPFDPSRCHLGQCVVRQQRRHHGSSSRAAHGWFRRAL